MKNLILSFAIAGVAIIGSANTIYAQSNKTKFGIKAGVSLMTLGAATSNGVSVNYNHRPGFQGGIFTETSLSNSILFTAQALYTQKGGNVNTTISGINFKGSTQVDYIDVPLLVGVKANSKLAFYFGPQVSFLLSQKTVMTASNGANSTSTDKTGLKSTLFGGNIGAGYKFTDNVGINVNYIFDFSNAAEKAYDSGEKNSGFLFTLGYSF